MADRRVLSMQPESGFYHKRAMKSIDKEDFAAALRHLRKAIAMEPENVAYRMDLANTYARMGLYERSNLEIELLLHKKSLPAEAFFGLGSNFLAMGDYDQAQTMLEAYEQIDPQGAYIDETEEALGYISECDYETELDRELDELSMNGKAALDAGDLEHAVDCLEQALAKDPDMTYARNNLAYAYFCLGNMSLAWKHVRRVLQQDPLDVSGRCNESCFYLAEGKPAQAPSAVIGRERSQASIVLRDPNVSRSHAELTHDGTGWRITDLNSTNGTLVNDVDVTSCPLQDGDLITVGLVNLEFRENRR